MLSKVATALVLVLFVGGFAFPLPVYAYLDPGTGSYIFQLIIGGFVGALFLVKVYWDRIKSLFVKGKQEEDDDNTA